MTIKIALLRSGERVISDIQEMVVSEKTIGYFFNKPCLVSTRKPASNPPGSFQIKLAPWIPVTKQTKIPVINDWVVTLVDPIDDLVKMYKTQILGDDKNEIDQNDSVDEQSDSDQSD